MKLVSGNDPAKTPDRPSTTFGEGRVCDELGCATRLSTYNAGGRCWQHADIVFPNFRGKRLRRDRA
jgi:hypothetical protein